MIPDENFSQLYFPTVVWLLELLELLLASRLDTNNWITPNEIILKTMNFKRVYSYPIFHFLIGSYKSQDSTFIMQILGCSLRIYFCTGKLYRSAQDLYKKCWIMTNIRSYTGNETRKVAKARMFIIPWHPLFRLILLSARFRIRRAY